MRVRFGLCKGLSMADAHIPSDYPGFMQLWADTRRRDRAIEDYVSRRNSFVPGLLPELAVALDSPETLRLLRARFGDSVDLALSARYTDPGSRGAELSSPLAGPVSGCEDGSWLKASNMVGINIRTIGSFWNVVKYMLTVPAAFDAVHILPFWEAGVVGSIYGISSWEVNPEFFSTELAGAFPHLDNAARQLKAMVNLLHAMGRTVGMEVIPHTDRYSEITVANPSFFEWLRREGLTIVDHREDLHQEAEAAIFDLVRDLGSAVGTEAVPATAEMLFAGMDEAQRLSILFGRREDHAGRGARRNLFVQHLHGLGLEPVPGTMGPPYRGLEVDPSPQACTVDEFGMEWCDYRIIRPQTMSRVFGPLSRYKLYGRREDNRDWVIDFSTPRKEVWDYVCGKYAQVQRNYGFDFMRGDMSHVQMRPEGVPEETDRRYDLLGAVKETVRRDNHAPYFSYFAESFLAPPGTMAYGDEIDHLEASGADATLGDLQSTEVGSPEFVTRLAQYSKLAATRSFAPAFTAITADKDDPRFDEYYRQGNEVRLFICMFLGDLPGYMGLGYRVRDVHLDPAPNEHYTKLYVFQEKHGPKATTGPFVWGQNGRLFHYATRLGKYLDFLDNSGGRGRRILWLLAPDPTMERSVIAWTQAEDPHLLLVANLNCGAGASETVLPAIPDIPEGTTRTLEFSTRPHASGSACEAPCDYAEVIEELAPGEGRAYRLRK